MTYFDLVVNALECEIAVLDAQGTIVFVNQAWRDFGVSNGAPVGEQFVGRNYLGVCGYADARGNHDASLVITGMHQVMQGKLPDFSCEYRCDAPDQRRWFTLHMVPLHGVPEHFLVTHSNITASKESVLANQQALQESGDHAQAVLDHIADGVITIDTDGCIQSFNNAARDMFGYTSGEVIGRNVGILMPQPDQGHHAAYLGRYLSTGETRMIGKPREVNGLRKNGDVFPINISVSKLRHAEALMFIGVVRDLSRQRRDQEELRRLSFYDALTGLPNRRLLLDRMKHALLACTRTGQHGAVMFLDLDHFKALNDSLGHEVGDLLLQEVARRIRSCVHEDDSVARMGGDEFVVLLESLSIHVREAANQAEHIAKKIQESLSHEYQLQGHSYHSTPSIGIVVFMEAHETVEELVKRADAAMYQAKAAGRNRLRFYDPVMQAAVASHTEMERDLRLALTRGELQLHYQAQVDRTGEIIGAEALVRWLHPVRGMVSPAQFIPLAEDTGLILPLGKWVLNTACAQLAAWSLDERTANWSVAVNVSASQFAQVDFVQDVADALAAFGADAHLLKLELTESMLVKDVNDIISKMKVIRNTAVGFSLDDFGTGYSSLAYLKKLPLNQLKIDQSFVRDVLTDSSDGVIARTVVALGHSLGLSVIAEGVETAAQRDYLAECGCDAYQGYFFGRPAPAAALLKALQLPVLH